MDTTTATRICPVCGRTLVAHSLNFAPCAFNKDGRSAVCRQCESGFHRDEPVFHGLSNAHAVEVLRRTFEGDMLEARYGGGPDPRWPDPEGAEYDPDEIEGCDLYDLILEQLDSA